ncbi:hypothetical protein [Gemmobacter serpentinus]|uniref:hypothetical protein n=1 Tax=Gemmobacter serpentinus TaxID=2652247 RepID=UPI00124EA25C|nr:hypothetical protein [Gemmobacter serpentinus]
MNAHDDPPKPDDLPAASANEAGAKPQALKGREQKTGGAPSREDRLKAALKANMGRRKAQARARAASDDNNEKE